MRSQGPTGPQSTGPEVAGPRARGQIPAPGGTAGGSPAGRGKDPAALSRLSLRRPRGRPAQKTLSCRLTLGRPAASGPSAERTDSVRPEPRLSRRPSGLPVASGL